jgi:hypothetical protein
MATRGPHIALAAAILLAVPVTALAASTASFSGKTAQGIKVGFRAGPTVVSNLKTSLDVLCISGYPSTQSEIQIVAVAPTGSARLRGGHFTFTLPTVSKSAFTTLTGTIRGRSATGSLKTSFEKTWSVYNPVTGFYQLSVAACSGKTTWSARAK